MTIPSRPSPGIPREYCFPAIERTTLSNGMRIAVARMPRLPLVTVLALVDAGASCDAAGREGTASLTVDALAEGTTKLDGARTALVNAQANVTQQSSATVNLHTCLGGVERALNALALGDPNGAVGALTAVAGSCSSAVTAGG